MNRKLVKVLLVALVSILGLFALFYLGGIAGQVLENYQAWLEAGGMTGQAQIARVSWKLGDCFSHAFTGPGLAGMLVLLTAIGAIFPSSGSMISSTARSVTSVALPSPKTGSMEPLPGCPRRR